jgi:bleomycin hydrolase
MLRFKLLSVLPLSLIVFFNSVHGQSFDLPENMELVVQCASTDVKSQDRTGTCWSFSTSSFLESEVIKLTGKSIDVSEMYTVRNIYLEKAEKYLRYHGTCQFSQGSLAHDVFNSYLKYGMMPEEAFSGKMPDSIHNHKYLVSDLKTYLDSLLKSSRIDPHWKNEFSAILDQHLGSVPAVFEYEGSRYNAKTFAAKYLPIQMADYVGITSFTHHPFFESMVVEVPDNFSDGRYFNLPLDQMIETINSSLKNGHSVEWDGDVSEIGFLGRQGFAVLSNDTAMLKSDPINSVEMEVTQESRQAEFDNLQTTDDHLMHITGMTKSDNNKTYYIVKNSWGERAGLKGYLLMSESYMRMKTVSIYVNRTAVSSNLNMLIHE